MQKELVGWDMYEVNSDTFPLTGNRIRGRLRKFTLENNINFLVENTQDGPPRIRFAVLAGEDISLIKNFLEDLSQDIQIEIVFEKVKNPVLSRTQVNLVHRYENL